MVLVSFLYSWSMEIVSYNDVNVKPSKEKVKGKVGEKRNSGLSAAGCGLQSPLQSPPIPFPP
jgi:hypothetical protein